ncbi:MAG: CoA transferase [Dehalococcoidia bacterium]|nr:CoA transferase [Dehalococcoidia bacterium]
MPDLSAGPNTGPNTGPLRDIRVIDVTDARAELAGRVLADLGAEVVKIEPPGGSPSRRMPPFEHGLEGDPDGSLYWAAVALGKRSVVLDIAAETDRETLRRLLAEADVFVESANPGEMDARGLGYEAVHELNPALVYVSVTPWGQDGPMAGQPASELTLEAAGGLLALQGAPLGDRDRPPVPIGYPQAAFHAGAQAAADAVVALNERARSGLGQHLDVSTQAAVVWTLMNATGFPPNEGGDPPGAGDDRANPVLQRIPGLEAPSLVACADGCAFANFRGGPTLAGLLQWAAEEAPLDPELEAVDWANWLPLLQADTLDVADVNAAVRHVVEFVAGKTKSELQARAVSESLLVAPIFTVEDIDSDPQLAARDYWREFGGRRHPGRFVHLSATPAELHRGAPALDEGHELLDASRPPVVHRNGGSGNGARSSAFEGLKVADFTWVGVGPIIVKALADHGATVVHVESATRLDVLRGAPPFKNGEPGMDNAQFMANFNSSKLGLTLNLATKEGRGLARRLTGWADVVAESFTPGTMTKLGLDWETLSEGRPDLVMLSSCLRGQTGPERTYGGFGTQGAALAGLHHITGWPDRLPAGPWGAYTDLIAPRYGLAALGSALYERNASGRGQHVDLSQVEAAIHFIEPLLLDYTVNGRVAQPAGHHSLTSCPHGVYAAAGTERYVAIDVQTAEQWHALIEAVPSLYPFDDEQFDSLAARRVQRPQLDVALRQWCAGRDAWEVAEELRAFGVPAAALARPSDLYEDPQLSHRGFFVTLDHSVMGPTPYDGPVTHFSETPARLRKAAPTLGEDTHYVLEQLLGLSGDEISRHAAAGVLT